MALLRQLARSNLESLQIAKDLLVAQAIADTQSALTEPAVEKAAASGGDPVAVEQAMAAVAAANHANTVELALARTWGIHFGEVHRLVEVTTELLDRLSGVVTPELSAHEQPDLLRY